MNAPYEPEMLDAIASTEAEQALLGGLLMDDRLWDAVGDVLKPSDFFGELHQSIFSTLMVQIIANKPVDVISVFDTMRGQVELKYLHRLSQFAPSFSSMRQYAGIIRERSVSRDLLAAAAEIQDLARDHTIPFETRMDEAAGKLAKLLPDSPRDDWQDAGDGMMQFLEGIDRAHNGEEDFLPTGLKEIDDKLDGGMRKGEVIVIAGRPGMGKTALGMTICENVADAGEQVGFLSMEMPKAQVNRRRVAMKSGVPLHKLKRPERMSDFDWSQMTAAVEKVRLSPMDVSDQGGLNINQVRLKARKLKRRKGLRVLMIDYIGLMEGTDKKANRSTQLGEVSRGIKALAKELDCTVLLLAQLNRDVEKRPNQRPMMSDLRECGDIEQDADIILFVHRPIHIKPDLGPEWKRYAEIILGKQRDGDSGMVLDMQYVGESVHFFDWVGERPTSLVLTKRSEL
ncbi:hypothetical protein RD110_15720 [Rhodoferax koreense]|uniref:DNA 5'-3' helicase n=1 Tax=Rhodoferax koreensis TaxID=1842727 RepID=A0A1P8JXI4_9BURK|nr:replicative DNA helicase [Rhodoferax koreense]APW38469.1 hypothetical protein RD110_15720 [Rhodoferax koreense]